MPRPIGPAGNALRNNSSNEVRCGLMACTRSKVRASRPCFSFQKSNQAPRGFSSDAIGQLRRAFKILYRQGLTLDLALQRLESMFHKTSEVQVLIDSIRASERGIVR